ncbi:MAG: hypothetical protein N2037_13090, partial [Acidimicrobiales bacterium]|nr:hypothetical protein [Acidimicrobiales bacterium]
MTSLDGATFLLQWATGGLAFLWVTTRRRQVGLGYGWLLRGVYGAMAVASALVGLFVVDTVVTRELASVAVAVSATAALAVSVARRRVGVSGQEGLAEQRSARVAAMTGIERSPRRKAAEGPEFPPALDLIAPAVGSIGVIASALAAGGPGWLTVARFLVGAAFLGAVTDAMLLGHWYLVQPGLPRAPILELVRWCFALAVPEILLLLLPTGMVSVIDGTIPD